LAALKCELGNLAYWTQPQGGLFVWVTLPTGVDLGALFPRAIENQVAYIPGAHFAPDGRGPANTLRLNYSNVTPERIREGVRRLAEVIKAHLFIKM
jgi:DNA-binding transcriptional MocR family regulator